MRTVPPFVAFTRARGPDPARRLEEGVADPEPGSGDGAESIGEAKVLTMAVGIYGFVVTTRCTMCARAIPQDAWMDSLRVLDWAIESKRTAASWDTRRFRYSRPPWARTFSKV